jgi:hypothetical protein
MFEGIEKESGIRHPKGLHTRLKSEVRLNSKTFLNPELISNNNEHSSTHPEAIKHIVYGKT